MTNSHPCVPALVVNPMTVSKAYALLEVEGLLERRTGLTSVVAARHAGALPLVDREAMLLPALQRVADEARQLQIPPERAARLFQSLLDAHTA